jgi:large subunit ribosomal protein L19
VIAIRGSEINQSFTVRKIAVGSIGVERIWPINCPSIEKIIVLKKGQVRKAKLYYLRKRVGKQAMAVDNKKEEIVKEEKITPVKVKKSEKIPLSKSEQTKPQ